MYNDSSKNSEKWMSVFRYSNWSYEHDNSNVCCQTMSTLWRNLSTSIKDMFKKCYTDPEIIFCKVNWTYVVFICNHFWECNTIDIAWQHVRKPENGGKLISVSDFSFYLIKTIMRVVLDTLQFTIVFYIPYHNISNCWNWIFASINFCEEI